MLVTFRECLNGLIGHRIEKTHVNHAVDCRSLRCSSQTPQLRNKRKEIRHAHLRICWSVFRQITDQTLGPEWIFQHTEPAHHNGALSRRNKPCDHTHGGRFPGSIGAQEPEHLPLFYPERDAVYRLLLPEKFL